MLALAPLVGCHDEAHTYVVVVVEAGSANTTGATEVLIDADLGDLHDSHLVDELLRRPFPFTLVLDLQRGEGRLKVSAIARNVLGSLARGSNEVDILRGQTREVVVKLGLEQTVPDGGLGDGGADGSADGAGTTAQGR